MQNSNIPSSERLEELLFLGSEITRPADFLASIISEPRNNDDF